MTASLFFDHACPTPGGGTTRRWCCPECGTRWIYLRRVVGRRAIADWLPISRFGLEDTDVSA
jgi:hypothetical protein